MADERIHSGVFVSDDDKPFDAVRQIKPHGRPEMVVYVENAGDTVQLLVIDQDIHVCG